MPDIEPVATKLLTFDRAAGQRAGGIGFQRAVGMPLSPKPAKQQIYQGCVALLSDEERAELDRLIEKMMPAAQLPPRPSAIQP